LPLPFTLRVLALSDTEMRALHLGLALFLAFMVYPFGKRSSSRAVPQLDAALALTAACCASYQFLLYRELSTGPGQPTPLDFGVGVLGVLSFLAATRRVASGQRWPSSRC
jgi:TRAP-type uncharacterized transport system fused permease subunit